MADARGTSGTVVASFAETADIRMTIGRTVAAYNVPSKNVTGTASRLEYVMRQLADIRATSGRLLVAVRGRTADPKVRAWTFTLDGHDYYVLRLGDTETLVYDVLTEQWYNWGASTRPVLPVSYGINWLGADNFAASYGSNILVGDDTFGSLYLMSPTGLVDDDPVTGPVDATLFTRIVMGQVPLRGYDATPCFGVQLYGDVGEAAQSLTVTLETSDDAGHTFQNQGALTISTGDYVQRINWDSLGSMVAPGRLFKITDQGAFARIDGLELMGVDSESE